MPSFDDMTAPNDAELVIGRIEIVRYLDADGRDIVAVHTDDTTGKRLPVVDALGMLGLATWDVCDPHDEDEP